MRYLLLFSSCFFSPRAPVHPPSHCSRGKPIAGNTSLGSDRKEGRKEGKTRNRGIVTTPRPRERPLCRSCCCSFGRGALRCDGEDEERENARSRLISSFYSGLAASLSLSRFLSPLPHIYIHVCFISYVSSPQPRREAFLT